MHFKVRVYFFISFDSIINKALVLSPAPGRARTGIQAETRIFPPGDIPFGAFSVSFPMETAAGINKPLYIQIAAIQQKTYQRIVIVQFRVGGNNNAWFWLCVW